MIVVDKTDEESRWTVCIKTQGQQFYHSFWVGIKIPEQKGWLHFSRADVSPVWRETGPYTPIHTEGCFVVRGARTGPFPVEREIIESYWRDPE